ncbi:hypothetical protein A176_002448 [Myxococcus hansupus]|uniref:Uncharacterized protein n=1 Tax=Pseudomyxococcus hansupus TaxID=1297742 RepID=A0A0H4WPW2_9BACT|nr:hypothetical protein A176_002448 [Myxococcus hansupus]
MARRETPPGAESLSAPLTGTASTGAPSPSAAPVGSDTTTGKEPTPDASSPEAASPESPTSDGAAEAVGAEVAAAVATDAAGVAATAAVAVLMLESNDAGRDAAPGVTSLITSRLAESSKLRVLSQWDVESALDAAGQKKLEGLKSCERGDCVEELVKLTGARYVVAGRLDRFGDHYLLTANLLDTTEGRSLARPRAEADDAEDLLRTAKAVSDQLFAVLVSPEESVAARPLLGGSSRTGGGGLLLGLRVNNNFIDKLSAVNPGGDIEVGYWFHPEWVGFIQVGFNYVRSTQEGVRSGLNVLPSVVGARHYHNLERSLRPYWGFGLGVQLSFGDFGIFQSTGPLPTVIGFAGLEYLIAGKVGFQLELGTNVAQAVLGLADSKLGDGLNLDLNAGIAYHF